MKGKERVFNIIIKTHAIEYIDLIYLYFIFRFERDLTLGMISRYHGIEK